MFAQLTIPNRYPQHTAQTAQEVHALHLTANLQRQPNMVRQGTNSVTPPYCCGGVTLFVPCAVSCWAVDAELPLGVVGGSHCVCLLTIAHSARRPDTPSPVDLEALNTNSRIPAQSAGSVGYQDQIHPRRPSLFVNDNIALHTSTASLPNHFSQRDSVVSSRLWWLSTT
jgi:hypothetical protein